MGLQKGDQNMATSTTEGLEFKRKGEILWILEENFAASFYLIISNNYPKMAAGFNAEIKFINIKNTLTLLAPLCKIKDGIL